MRDSGRGRACAVSQAWLRVIPLTAFLLNAVLAAAPAAAIQVGDTTADTTAAASAAGTTDTLPLQAVPAARAEQDGVAETELRATFGRIESLRTIAVRVEAGIATLSGVASTLLAREQADSLARITPGVIVVDNRIVVDTSLRARLAETVDRIRAYLIDMIAWLPLLVVALLIVGMSFVLGNLVMRWEGPQRRVPRNPFMRNLVQRVIRAIIVLVGMAVALDLLGATGIVGIVAGTAGIAGLAISFAFRDIMENYLAGVILSFRQPFAPNDQIGIEGQEGKVVRLTARETILMTADGNHVRLPNATVFRAVMINYTRNPLRRFSFSISVGAAEDLANVQDIGVKTLREMAGVLSEPPARSVIDRVGDSWVDVSWFGWVDQSKSEFAKARSEAIRLVKLALETAGVSLPSPEYRVAIERQTRAKAGKPSAGTRTAAPPAAVARDLSVDTAVDAQIEADRRMSGDEDLLKTGDEQSGPVS